MRYKIAKCCTSLLCFTALAIAAQSPELLHARMGEQILLLVSDGNFETRAATAFNTEISTERHGDSVRYIAKREGVITRSNWYRFAEKAPWVVFATGEGEFREVDNRIVVKLHDPRGLSALAQELRATRSKHYAGLGYAVLWLSRASNPIQITQRLRADKRVRSAEVQFKQPRQLPL